MKRMIASLLILCMLSLTVAAFAADENQWQYRYIRTTDDSKIDSLSMSGKRMYIETVWAWYDNASNTNTYEIEIVEGMTAMAVQGTAGRLFKWGQAMTSGGRLALSIPQYIGVTTTKDSTVYFSISAASSDTLIACYKFKYIN